MRLRLGAFTISSETSVAFGAEAEREQAATEQERAFLDQVPPLRPRRHCQWGGVRQLIDDGWTPDELTQLLEAWPEVTWLIGRQAIIDLAALLRRYGIQPFCDVIAWTHVFFESVNHGLPHPDPRFRKRTDGLSGLVAEVDAFVKATGSQQAALRAAQAGLTASQARRSHDPPPPRT